MNSLAVLYLRMTVVGLLALAAAACVRLGPPEAFAARPAPRVGEPPSAVAGAPVRTVTDDERVEALERQVADLNADLTHLRKALQVMGPLPDSDQYFIPVADDGKSKITFDDLGAGIPASDIYAPAPRLAQGQSLFYEAELGSYPSMGEAQAGWRKLSSEIRLAGLEPRYDRTSSTVQLSIGPLTSKAAVEALCVELSALAGPCRVAAPMRAMR